MPANGIHVVPLGVNFGELFFGAWKVVDADTKLDLCICLRGDRAKQRAVRIGRALAKEGRTSLRIHGQNGRILEERSYGNETKRPG